MVGSYLKENVPVYTLTTYEKRRFHSQKYCPFCDQPLWDFDIITWAKRRHKRRVQYIFLHSYCYDNIIERGCNIWDFAYY